MRTIATIEARMRSTRLPGKVLLPVVGKPLLELMVERLRLVPELDGIMVATTDDNTSTAIAELAARLGIGCFQGSEDDVLDRVLQAAKAAGAELIVETTGDCPLIDPATVSKLIAAFHAAPVDYCANVLRRTYPLGMAVQVFPVAVLEKVAAATNDPADREHVSLYIYEHPKIFRLKNVESGLPADAADLRLTVDTPEDFEVVRRIFEALYPANPGFGLMDILSYLAAHPEIAAINRAVAQKAAR